MKKSILRVIAMVLVICAMQGMLVPSVSAATETKTYDFYTPYKKYTYLFHWRVPGDGGMAADATKANSQIPQDYAAKTIDWNLESNSGYGTIVKKTWLSGLIELAGWVSINMGKNTKQVFRFRSPGTGNYEVDINYYVTNSTDSNIRSEVMIIPAETGKTYTAEELSAHLSKYRAQAEFSCYDANEEYDERKVTIPCSFLDNQEYFFVVSGGPRQSDNSKDGLTYLRSFTTRYVGEYDPPVDPEYARPVTILEEALTRWEEGYPMVAEANGKDYLAIPIYGGKMYVFNMETNQLVDVVNTGIDVPRGAAADDNGVIYITGASYNIFMYDLKTNKPGKSPNVNTDGVSLGSLYDISYGDDRNLYTGTDKGHVIQYNPNTDTVTPIFLNDALESFGIKDVGYVSSVLQQGDYIYAAVTNKVKKHYLVKLNKNTFEVEGVTDYTSTGPSTYMSYMSITEEGLILGNAKTPMVVDTNTMTLTGDEFSSALVQCYVSEKINGKYYYVSSTDRHLYCYDPTAEAGKQVTKKTNIGQFFDCHGKTITLDRDGDGKDEKYLLAIEGAKQYEITLVNPETGASFKVKLPIGENAGGSTGVNSLTAGKPGSNELYYGGFTSNQVHVFNTETGKITGMIPASGIQTDAIYVDGDTIYAGNYTEAQLTRLNGNKPQVLMTLHNSLFNQSRIHSVTGGDNKIFFGTFPYVYAYGGVLAWYDTTTGLSSVAVGPTSNDVYYSKDNANWYDNEACEGEPVTAITGTTADKDVDGVDGVVLNQGIKEVAYHNGILYAATSREGGTNTSATDELRQGTSAVIIAYDVEAKKVIATFDPTTQGFASPIPAVGGIEVDGNGTLWCVVSETLFTLTLNADNTFTYSEKISFDKAGYDLTQNRANSDILFKDGYVYVGFERLGGLCKINMNNFSDYTNLLPYVTSNGQVPESFAFGEDGNLYFLLGSSLKMLPLDATEEEWGAASVVTEQIKAITPETVAEAKQAYKALTLRQKSLVQNYDVLIQAEADAMISSIEALGEITWEKRERVQSLLSVYQAMPQSQQTMITNYYLLASANQQILELERNAPIVVTNELGEQKYYHSLELALEETTIGTVALQQNVTAQIANMHPNTVLNLNGYTLTVDIIVGTVMDTSDGEGLIKIAKNTEEKKNAVLTTDVNRMILWDNTNGSAGYRVFSYKLQNLGLDAHKDDASESTASGMEVKSFWSDVVFTNKRAYALVASGQSDLEIAFEVNWIPEGGEKTSKTFQFQGQTVAAWAMAEEGNPGDKNYCFYIRLTGFEELLVNGSLEVKPVLKTAFESAETEPTELRYTYVVPNPGGLIYETGFGNLKDAGINR